MELATIEMPKAEARERLAEYTESLKVNRNIEDERIAAGYRTLSRGLPVIQMTETIAAGGYFDNGLPRLAVTRADTRICYVHRYRPSTTGGPVEFTFSADDPWNSNRGALVGVRTVKVTVPDAPLAKNPPHTRWWTDASTMVPLIPPAHRPKSKGRLRRFHLLWEVEEWKQVPPKDPALLRHIGGDLWAVVAMWDLTEIERAVLAGRA